VAESDLTDADRDAVAEAPDPTAADAFDYSRPDLPVKDLILLARSRLRDAPPEIAAWSVKPADWHGDDALSLAQREILAEWPPSATDLDRLDALGWPPLAIGVWHRPYLFDVHQAAGASVEEAATACASVRATG
jgi:hypothetical protein